MGETSPQKWSIVMQATRCSPIDVVDVSLAEAERFLLATPEALTDLQSWRYEFIICGSLQVFEQETYNRLTDCFKCITPHKLSSRDTIEFNLHVDLEHDLSDDPPEQRPRTYSVTDNIFNIYWTYYPSARTTRGLLIYTVEEAAGQVSHVLKQLPKYAKYRSWPLLPGLMGLQAEIQAMRPRITYLGRVIMAHQIHTGYHNYASTTSDLEYSDAGLIQASKTAGFNLASATTNVYWVQCMVELARFLNEESTTLIELHGLARRTDDPPAYKDSASTSEWFDVVPQLREHIGSWQRSSEAMLREAEHWKEQASLVLQALATLPAPRA